MIRQYDEAMKEFCTRKMPNGSAVPLVGPVSPQRAFASMREILKDDPRVKKDPRFIPLPAMSFDRLDPVFAQERYQGAHLRKLRYSNDANMTYNAERPMPWDIPYSVEIWAEKEDDGAYLLEAFLRQWRRPVAGIEVWHGDPYGWWTVYIHPPTIIDNSKKDPETGDREIRYTLTMTVEGFLSFPTFDVPTVRTVNVEEALANRPVSQPDDIEQQVIPFTLTGEENT